MLGRIVRNSCFEMAGINSIRRSMGEIGLGYGRSKSDTFWVVANQVLGERYCKG